MARQAKVKAEPMTTRDKLPAVLMNEKDIQFFEGLSTPEVQAELESLNLNHQRMAFAAFMARRGTTQKAAALSAGYSPTVAGSVGCTLYKLPEVKRAIEIYRREMDLAYGTPVRYSVEKLVDIIERNVRVDDKTAIFAVKELNALMGHTAKGSDGRASVTINIAGLLGFVGSVQKEVIEGEYSDAE